MTSITIPNSVTTIGNSALSSCTSLTSITIPNSVTSIREYAFSGCSGLTNIIIPNSVKSIGNFAFKGCASLKELIIEDGESSLSLGYNSYSSSYIGQGLFYDCPLQTLYLGRNLSYSSTEDYGYSPFYELTKLKSVTIGNSVTSIRSGAFRSCRGLTSITIPNSVTSIGEYAFRSCRGLTSVIIPNGVTSIGDDAFNYCDGLTSITIGNSVTSIGKSAFENCSGLTSVNISDLEAWCKIDFNNSYSNPLYYAKKLYLNGELLTGLIIPDSIKEIKNYAFSGCSGLTSVTVPNSVTSIGGFAFAYCTGLTTIKVETGNSKYDSRNNCNAIIETSTNTLIAGCKNTIIPNGVTSIGDGAFSGCRGLTSVTIPNSVTSIGDDAFYYCSGLISVISLNPIPPTCESVAFAYVSVGNITLEVPAESVSLYQSADTWKDFGTIKGIAGSSALTYNILNETDVEVTGGTEKYTGDIVIPSQTSIDGKVYNVTKVRHYAFYECTGLTSITIPNSVTSIGDYAFDGCSGLSSVTIPNSVTIIGQGAFSSCSSLTAIKVGTGNSKYDSRNNCNAIIETESNTLITGCKNTIIPNSVTSIGNSAFRSCSSLSSVTIPNSVTSIGDYAFRACSGLTSITIPNSVTSIGFSAFSVCSSLTSVNISDLEAWCKIDFNNSYSNPLYYAKKTIFKW